MTSDPRPHRDDAQAADSSNGAGERYVEIGGVGRRRNIIGLISYLLLFAAVAAVLVLMFQRFTGHFWLAAALVSFMVAYMALMGWWASRNHDGRSD
jgi:hypothetical protein